jgi:hypothetical protein
MKRDKFKARKVAEDLKSHNQLFFIRKILFNILNKKNRGLFYKTLEIQLGWKYGLLNLPNQG